MDAAVSRFAFPSLPCCVRRCIASGRLLATDRCYPTANDDLPLGTGRIVLGWASLLFVLVGFTPMPFVP